MKIKMNSPNEVEEAQAEDNCTESYAKVEESEGELYAWALRLPTVVKGAQEKFMSCTRGSLVCVWVGVEFIDVRWKVGNKSAHNNKWNITHATLNVFLINPATISTEQ